MRKDIFIVGARLLGLWQLLGAVNSLSAIVANSLGYMQMPSYSREYNAIRFLVELIFGLFLLFRTHQLFNLVSRLADGEENLEEKSGSLEG